MHAASINLLRYKYIISRYFLAITRILMCCLGDSVEIRKVPHPETRDAQDANNFAKTGIAQVGSTRAS